MFQNLIHLYFPPFEFVFLPPTYICDCTGICVWESFNIKFQPTCFNTWNCPLSDVAISNSFLFLQIKLPCRLHVNAAPSSKAKVSISWKLQKIIVLIKITFTYLWLAQLQISEFLKGQRLNVSGTLKTKVRCFRQRSSPSLPNLVTWSKMLKHS